jgi:hypothetical protein
MEVFSPLTLALNSRLEMAALFGALGWTVEVDDDQLRTVAELFDLVETLEQLSSLTDSSGEGQEPGASVEQVIVLAERVFQSIETLRTVNPDQLRELPSPLDAPQTWTTLAARLPNYLITTWLKIHASLLYEFLNFSGLVLEQPGENEEQPSSELNWNGLGSFISDPVEALQSKYNWGGALAHDELFANLLRLCFAAGYLPKSNQLRDELKQIYYGSQSLEPVQEFELPLHQGWAPDGSAYFDAGLVLAPAPRNAAEKEITGLGLTNVVEGEADTDTDLGDGWRLSMHTTGELNGAIGLMIQPEGVSLTGASPSTNARLELSCVPAVPWVLLGNPEGARLELAQLLATLEVTGTASKPELRFSLRTSGQAGGGLKLVIAPADGDNFIAEVLGGADMTLNSDLGFVWSSETGFHFDGGAGFEVMIPLNVPAGPVRVELLRLALAGGTDGAQVEAAISGAIDLNVLAVVVDDIGIRAQVIPLSPGDTSGLLGPLDLKFEFKPPHGLGLVIDGAGIVTGGGYLEHDADKAQYAGVAEIGFLNLGLSAIGVLTTRMPDGSDGWSLFLSVFSEFPPIQVGFGFTLNGVGGLIGLNRTLDDDALRERLVQGALDSIMFPEDPVLNAPLIINDIEAIFPPALNQFIFGAMLKLGWGTPALVTADLGVMVELPDPIRIALLGQLEAILPTAEVRILELHMDVFGLADLTAQTLALDAVIRDSHIVELLTLSGDMALRADLLDQPTLLLSIGGFSPRFKAPAAYPTLRLMRASVPVSPLVSVDLSCYVALTSNTFQMGGRVDVWAKFAGFSAEGYVEMDALIQFVPFGFQFHTGFGVTVRAGAITLMGVEVSADLSGPSPWEVFGTATFEILKLKKDIKLEISVGQEKKNIAETYDVSTLLAAALSDPESWSAPEEGELATGVRLRDRDAAEEQAVFPAGRVQVTQRLVPLNTAIEAFGGGQIIGVNQFSIDQIVIGDEARPATTDEYLEEWFAPAQFFELKDNEKIVAPSFELMVGGIRFGTAEIATGNATELEVTYEEIVLDPKLNQRRRAKLARAALEAKQLAKVEKYGAAAKIRARHKQFRKIGVEPAYKVRAQKFVATNLDTGNLAEVITNASGKTYAETASLVRKQNRASLSPLEQFGVAPREELALTPQRGARLDAAAEQY